MLQSEYMTQSRFAMWHGGLADTSPISLHITGPSKCPLVDKPHPAFIATTRPAVTGCVREDVEQVVWNGPSVANGYNWQFSQDTLNRNIVQYWVPVVDIMYDLRSY